MESRNWIGGEWIIPSGSTMVVKNPSCLSEEVGVVQFSDASQVRQAEQAARQALAHWAGMAAPTRGEVLYRMAAALETEATELAELASREMGKPLGEMRGEVMRGVNLLRYYAAEGVRAIGSVIPSVESDVLQYSKRVTLGVTAVITPWNFPVAIPLWKIAPALICGNTVIWKPAENASLTAVRLMEILSTQLPPGAVNLVVGKGSEAGAALIEEAQVDAVSFTGSTVTGKKVAVACSARNIKFQTEMGGKNAAIVLRDADLEKTVPMLLSGAFRFAGQKCTATSRIIVEREVYDALAQRLRDAVMQCAVGSALDPRVYLGPVASLEQYKKVRHYMDIASREANVVAQGTMLSEEGEGYFLKPLVVSGVGCGHALVQEEVFGPLAVLLPADDFEHAVALCNQTVYGLSASLFTRDLSLAHRFLDEAQAGMVRVNQETAGVEYQAPFGGMKLSSSHSREQGQAALDFYSAVKTCAIKYML